ncbi:MAG: hypothetical protein JNK82_06435 [Myxococcaceae bacterium]|nr:hypothetical protein [Myxococcaceae bacterium]
MTGTAAALALAALLASDDGKTDFAKRIGLRHTLGLGAVPLVPGLYWGSGLDVTFRPFRGAFIAGGSGTYHHDLEGRWLGASGGLFFALDLTYVLVSLGWSQEPRRDFPFRWLIGSRIGFGGTVSWLRRPELENPAGYQLVRPETCSWVDLEWVPDHDRTYFIRFAIETPVNLSTVFRGFIAVGVAWGFDA